MLSINYTDFKRGLTGYLDKVVENNETLIINRKRKQSVVVMPLREYNSIMETLHLLKSRKNAEWLFESIEELKNYKT